MSSFGRFVLIANLWYWIAFTTFAILYGFWILWGPDEEED